MSLSIQFSTVPLVTGSLSHFAIAAGLLCLNMLNSSALSLFSPSFSYFISGRPRRRLPVGNNVARQGLLLPAMRTTCPYHYFELFPKLCYFIVT